MKAKRSLSVMLAAAMAFGMLGAFGLSASAIEGSGTSSDPYIVTTAEELGLISDFPDAHFKLGSNIKLSGSFGTPAEFSGTIDGNGCLIEGLGGQGFIYTNTGTITDLIVEIDEMSAPFINTNEGTVERTAIVGGEISSRAGNAGTFARTNNGTIRDCFSSTQLTVNGMYASSSVGGFVGLNGGTIENSLYTGNIYCRGTTTNGDKINNKVSPFVGDNDEDGSPSVTNCYYDEEETDDATKNAGGAVGKTSLGLTIRATYEGWDFSNVWAIGSDKNGGLPYFQSDRRFNGQELIAATPTPKPTAEPTPVPTQAPTQAPVATPTQAPSKPEEVTVNVNGRRVSFDQPPIITNDRTLVPMRAIFEALGADVDWNGDALIASATRGNIQIGLLIGGFTMTKITGGSNVEFIELDVAPVVINNRTLVPARAIAESFDCVVDWDGDTMTVDITDTTASSNNGGNASANTNTNTNTQPSTCDVCGGSGRVTCTFCGGTGEGLPIYIMGIETPQGCTYCGGAGWRVCDGCGGSGQK